MRPADYRGMGDRVHIRIGSVPWSSEQTEFASPALPLHIRFVGALAIIIAHSSSSEKEICLTGSSGIKFLVVPAVGPANKSAASKPRYSTSLLF